MPGPAANPTVAGTEGIGLAIARDLMADGWRVGVLARRVAGRQDVAQSLGDSATLIQCDVANERQIEAAAETVEARFGPIVGVVTTPASAQRPRRCRR
jgi:NAD(P)-dependent dehydrogenase (short-subunit alcohol dehydrogenase family)